MSQLYTGTVTDRERVRDWLLIHTKENSRPLAIVNGSIWPPNGAKISAQVNPGRAWDFAESREVSVDSDPAPPYELEKRIPGMAQLIAPLILDWLRWHRTVCSDDIHDAAVKLAPAGRDPRVIGAAFATLSRQKKIRRVGIARSHRKVNHYYPNMAIWELVRQAVND